MWFPRPSQKLPNLRTLRAKRMTIKTKTKKKTAKPVLAKRLLAIVLITALLMTAPPFPMKTNYPVKQLWPKRSKTIWRSKKRRPKPLRMPAVSGGGIISPSRRLKAFSRFRKVTLNSLVIFTLRILESAAKVVSMARLALAMPRARLTFGPSNLAVE